MFSTRFPRRFFNSFYQLNKDKKLSGQGQNMKKTRKSEMFIPKSRSDYELFILVRRF
ncbi:hypothetical protein MUS_0830 [Bacillus velezensis YAU B9601-Y2]|uniref:Uncharacterized protein n=1 Tax=Bacillus amyloliquefaciens (strain Y2) TaxID=1155777 RepID=I2C2K5_BACAY|nr:hypothetical protein MUS_0830 [Bacillus velezensis YAU B9601-Y2]